MLLVRRCQALERARGEQDIEDYNALQRLEGSLHRRVIVLPLTDHFDPPPGIQGHGKLQVRCGVAGLMVRQGVSCFLARVLCARRSLTGCPSPRSS